MLIEKQSKVCPERAPQAIPPAPRNLMMRERRRTLGLTRKDLAILSSVKINDIQAMETFANVGGRLNLVNSKLHCVANVLELNFDDLFPPAYLLMLEERKVLGRVRPFCWRREIRLGKLSPRDFGYALTADTIERVDLEIDRGLLRRTVDELLGELTPRERFVVEKRFGFDGEDTRTLEEVGCLLNVTPQRIRQVEAHAFRRLRHPTCSKRLTPFLIEYTSKHRTIASNH